MATVHSSPLLSRLPRRLFPYFRDNLVRRGASSRYFASAATTTTHQKQTTKAVPPELTDLPPSLWVGSDSAAHAIATAPPPASKFHVPPVILPTQTKKTYQPLHKIHILGDDVRSRFIAHALCGVYDSVESIGNRGYGKMSDRYRPLKDGKYRNFEAYQPERTRRDAHPEPLAPAAQQHTKARDDSHIHNLIVTGHGYEAVKAINRIKHRVDETTSVCLLNDGLGVLETVRDKVFGDVEKKPNFILGHMSHALVYNRAHNSVKQLKPGRIVVAQTNRTPESKDLVRSLWRVKSLGVTSGGFANWLRFKLPAVVFTATVEPICVFLEINYEQFLGNRSALRILNQLLSEIVAVVEEMPELEGVTDLRRFMTHDYLYQWCIRRITGKASAPAELARRIERGLPTDVNYQNGFFLNRAKKLGIEMPMNTLVTEMLRNKRVHAKHRNQAWVKFEEKTAKELRDLSERLRF